MITRKINLKDPQEALELLGEQDILLRQMENDFGVEIFLRQDMPSNALTLTVKGNSARADKAMRKIRERINGLRLGKPAPADSPLPAGSMTFDLSSLPEDAIYRSAYGTVIKPRTKNQKKYVESILENELVFGIGPAGTGKTFLAVACALRALQAREVRRIVITRPVVEAGEKLGFLPGDLMEKVNPYLKPIYDAFFALLGPQRFKMWQETEVIEVVPLAYMRGRTFDDAFILLDEGQNTTPEQMKMFLTRMGTGSRAVVTGDITQTDLSEKVTSGLVRVMDILKNVDGIDFHFLTEEDVVRHPLVKKIIRAYDVWQKKQ